MEEQAQNIPQAEDKGKEKCCPDHGFCYCRAAGAILIIVLVWLAPSWANIGITILAALIVLGSGSCACRKKKK